jgi:hypothetical protein
MARADQDEQDFGALLNLSFQQRKFNNLVSNFVFPDIAHLSLRGCHIWWWQLPFLRILPARAI